jgi:hypothetical protein
LFYAFKIAEKVLVAGMLRSCATKLCVGCLIFVGPQYGQIHATILADTILRWVPDFPHHYSYGSAWCTVQPLSLGVYSITIDVYYTHMATGTAVNYCILKTMAEHSEMVCTCCETRLLPSRKMWNSGNSIFCSILTITYSDPTITLIAITQ